MSITQATYNIKELSKELKVSIPLLYNKARVATGSGGTGIIFFGDRSFFVIRTKSRVLFYECLLDAMDFLSKKYMCEKCKSIIGKVIENAI